MELKQAKDNVRQLVGKSFVEAIKINDIAESIRMVCEAAVHDLEAKVLLGCIPDSMAYMGLYPHTMKRFEPDGLENQSGN